MLLVIVGCILLAAGAAHAQGGGIERFYGTYAGEALSESGDELDKRDINAEVTPQGKGFKVKFTVVVKRGKDKPRRDEYTIIFNPSKRPGIYSSAMRTDVFGNAVPLDPLAGDPYMWARLEGRQVLALRAVRDREWRVRDADVRVHPRPRRTQSPLFPDPGRRGAADGHGQAQEDPLIRARASLAKAAAAAGLANARYTRASALSPCARRNPAPTPRSGSKRSGVNPRRRSRAG
jgi:hypothetical protein